jgi:hypothetical protein
MKYKQDFSIRDDRNVKTHDVVCRVATPPRHPKGIKEGLCGEGEQSDCFV